MWNLWNVKFQRLSLPGNYSFVSFP
jgi:hypothetical protein